MFYGSGYLTVVSVCAMEICFYLTNGPLHWPLLSEALNDNQFGFVSAMHYLGGVSISVITEYQIYYLQPWGTFLFYAICVGLNILFLVVFMRETDGLTDKQKKELYVPSKYQE